jgi:class 3 adenylate cyclase/uncharacterized membrane protein SpoIIM required for sporulation
MFIEEKIKESIGFIRQHNHRYIFTLILFLIAFLIGVIHPHLFENYQQKLLGQTPHNGLETFLFLFANNGAIAFAAMFLGFILGIVPFLLIIFNGYMIGTIFFNALQDYSTMTIVLRLLPHGIFEIPAIILSLGYGISSFDIFLKHRARNFRMKEYLHKYFKHMFDIYFLIIIPLLFASACIETLLIMNIRGEEIPIISDFLTNSILPFLSIGLTYLLYGGLKSFLVYLRKREFKYIILMSFFFLGVTWFWMKLYGERMSSFFETFRMITTFLPLALFLIYLYVENQKYRVSEEKKKVQGAFQHYVAPALVAEILKNPDKLKLGGEKKELTVFFSDIRGFTNLSEKLDPEQLVALLNEYLDVMTEVILEHRGVVDKYIGDAIMAFWGAPLDEPKHAFFSCKASLKMMQELNHFNAALKRKGLPEINIGIGLNTSPMVVGNMGSHKRFDYTVIGDAVNLGSRLESLNKQYGTHIIASEYTREQVIDDFEFRELDYVKVKGKNKPIRIFELMGYKGSVNMNLKDKFEKALELYRCKNFVQARSRFLDLARDGDIPSDIYVKRCEAFSKYPPSDDWDGVYVMTKK